MEKVMISQPMAGKTDEEIKTAREAATKILEKNGYEVVNTLFEGKTFTQESLKEQGVVQSPLYLLAKSLEKMSKCNAVYFCAGWDEARDCRIEHNAAVEYGLDVIYEK